MTTTACNWQPAVILHRAYRRCAQAGQVSIKPGATFSGTCSVESRRLFNADLALGLQWRGNHVSIRAGYGAWCTDKWNGYGRDQMTFGRRPVGTRQRDSLRQGPAVTKTRRENGTKSDDPTCFFLSPFRTSCRGTISWCADVCERRPDDLLTFITWPCAVAFGHGSFTGGSPASGWRTGGFCQVVRSAPTPVPTHSRPAGTTEISPPVHWWVENQTARNSSPAGTREALMCHEPGIPSAVPTGLS